MPDRIRTDDIQLGKLTGQLLEARLMGLCEHGAIDLATCLASMGAA